MIDVHVHLIPVRNPKFHEAVTENEDGSYSIFINSNLASNKQEEAYRHAMWHIQSNDLDGGNVQLIEARAHENAI